MDTHAAMVHDSVLSQHGLGKNNARSGSGKQASSLLLSHLIHPFGMKGQWQGEPFMVNMQQGPEQKLHRATIGPGEGMLMNQRKCVPCSRMTPCQYLMLAATKRT